MTNLYVVYGMLYSPSGWEDSYSDCVGGLIVRGLALAKRVAKDAFSKGGYGFNCYIEAPAPTITKFDDNNDYHRMLLDSQHGAITYYNSYSDEAIYL